MSGHTHDAPFPRLPLMAAGALVAITLVLVAVVRVTGVGGLHTPQAPIVAERLLHFADQPDGSITVRDALDGRLVHTVAPGTNGFLRGTLRGLGRERKREGAGPGTGFHLSARSDGRLLLQDPATGRLIDLGAFGPTNVAAFARLLPDGVRGAAGSAAPAIASAGTTTYETGRQLAASQQ